MIAGKGVVGGKMEQPTGFVLSMQNAKKRTDKRPGFELSITPGGVTVRQSGGSFFNMLANDCFTTASFVNSPKDHGLLASLANGGAPGGAINRAAIVEGKL